MQNLPEGQGPPASRLKAAILRMTLIPSSDPSPGIYIRISLDPSCPSFCRVPPFILLVSFNHTTAPGHLQHGSELTNCTSLIVVVIQ